MGLRFVQPDTTRLDLSEGDWIEVKTRLPYGDAERLKGAAMRRATPGQDGDGMSFDIDISAHALARMNAYVVDWNARDEQGKPIRLSADALKALDEDSAKEINEALDRHIEAQAQKKGQPTNVRPLNSPSVFDSAGVGLS